MAASLVVPGLWQVSLGVVNAFLLESDDGLIMIDTGFAGSSPAILEAVQQIGRVPTDIRHILVTHCHSDHAGSLAELKRIACDHIWVHPVDAVMVRAGKAMRPLHPALGFFDALICRFLIPSAPIEIEVTEIDHEVNDSAILPSNLKTIHVPGHCAGQLAFLWPKQGGVLIAADAAANVFGLATSPLYEDFDVGLQNLRPTTFRSPALGTASQF